MTADQEAGETDGDILARIGQEIADGPGWSSNLARRLDIDPRTLRRMLGGQARVPPPVLVRAFGLLADREIAALDAEIAGHGFPAGAIDIRSTADPAAARAAEIVAAMLRRRGFDVALVVSAFRRPA